MESDSKNNILLVTWQDGTEEGFGLYTDQQVEVAIDALRNIDTDIHARAIYLKDTRYWVSTEKKTGRS